MDFITIMHKRILTSGALPVLLFFLSCSDPQGFKKPEDALDAGREFVRAVLDGNYEKAEMYILPEKDDLELFARYRAHMLKQTDKDKRNLKEANIIINKVDPVNDTVSIVNFQNSWSNKPANLKVVQRDGNWYIDFKYTFSGDEALK
jgi:hypothetical protein